MILKVIKDKIPIQSEFNGGINLGFLNSNYEFEAVEIKYNWVKYMYNDQIAWSKMYDNLSTYIIVLYNDIPGESSDPIYEQPLNYLMSYSNKIFIIEELQRRYNGNNGPQGPQGDPGPEGPKGDTGITPTIGVNGNWFLDSVDTGKPSRGIQGPKGDTGSKGDTGNTGAQGIQGPKGDTGAQGIQGPKGDNGPKGDTGITPIIGANGNWFLDSVDTGKPSRGIQGPKGDTGSKGDKGDQGIQGLKGDKGDQGITGNDGITPTVGANGNWFLGSTDTGKPSRGIQGLKGDQGIQGPKGDKGDQGIQGIKGDPGQGIVYTKGTSTFTGNFTEQIIPHGLGVKPSFCHATATDNTDGDTGEVWARSDATNIYVGNTGAAGSSFEWVAIK